MGLIYRIDLQEASNDCSTTLLSNGKIPLNATGQDGSYW